MILLKIYNLKEHSGKIGLSQVMNISGNFSFSYIMQKKDKNLNTFSAQEIKKVNSKLNMGENGNKNKICNKCKTKKKNKRYIREMYDGRE